MSTTYSTTIAVAGVAQNVGPLSANTFMSFSNGGSDDPIIVSVNGLPASLTNGVRVIGTMLVNATGSNSGLWPVLAGNAFSIWAPASNQVLTVTYS
jgi:hypothetical protein